VLGVWCWMEVRGVLKQCVGASCRWLVAFVLGVCV
jgi:hypothetical protein